MTDLATPAHDHVDALSDALHRHRDRLARTMTAWGDELALTLPAGHRLLAAGNGGSAAQAQHLTAELVGRYRDDRPPFSAISLHAETSSVTAIANDYGVDALFERQVRAHGRPGDILIALSTSGASPNVLQAVDAARDVGLRTWALTGPQPNPLATVADEALAIDHAETPTVQELHLLAIHLLCEAFDVALATRLGPELELAPTDRGRSIRVS
jgi:D-sedoheptulose 7-phosphate isomerase